MQGSVNTDEHDVHGIVSRMRAGIIGRSDAKTAIRLAEATGFKYKASCSACKKRVTNIILGLGGYPAKWSEVEDTIFNNRVSICEGCPSYRKSTKSCGILLLGGLNKNTCGCYIPAKARFKNTHCPQGKW